MVDLQTALNEHATQQTQPKSAKGPKINKGAKPKTVKVKTPDGQVTEIPMETLANDPSNALIILNGTATNGIPTQKMLLKTNPQFKDVYREVSANLDWLTEQHKNPVRRVLNWVGDTWVGTILEVGAKVLVLTVTGWVLYDKYQDAQIEG